MNLQQTVLGIVAIAVVVALYFFVWRTIGTYLARRKKHRDAKFAPGSSHVMRETIVRTTGPVPWTYTFNVWLGFSDGSGFEVPLVTGAFTRRNPVTFVLTPRSEVDCRRLGRDLLPHPVGH